MRIFFSFFPFLSTLIFYALNICNSFAAAAVLVMIMYSVVYSALYACEVHMEAGIVLLGFYLPQV